MTAVDPGVTAVEPGRYRCLYRGLPGLNRKNRIDGRLEDRHPGMNAADPGVIMVPTWQTPALALCQHGIPRRHPGVNTVYPGADMADPAVTPADPGVNAVDPGRARRN